MVNITMSIPPELKKEMNDFPEINWSVIARAAIKQRLVFLKEIREFTKDSTLTEEDAVRMGRELNKRLAKRYQNENRG